MQGVNLMGQIAGGQPAADNTTIQYTSQGKLEIKDDGVSKAKLASDVVSANNGLNQEADGALSVKVDASTIEKDGSGNLQVKDGGITQAKLSTATGSQSGSIAGNTDVEITLNAYSFFPNIYLQNSGSLDGLLRPVDDNTDSQIGRFTLYNSADSESYDVQWRYVNSSDKNHWIYALKEANKIISIWEAPDHAWTESLHPFGKLKPNQEVIVFDDSNFNEIKLSKPRDNRSLAKYIFDEYLDDVEVTYSPRIIVEEDIHDTKQGEVIGVEKDGRKIKKMNLSSLPTGFKFKTLKKKGV